MKYFSTLLLCLFFVSATSIYSQSLQVSGNSSTGMYKSVLDDTNDTIGYPLNSIPCVYTFATNLGEFRGYVCGNNAFLDKAKVQYFPEIKKFAGISGVRMKFARATGNGFFSIGIWNASDQSGLPSTLIYTQQVKISDLLSDIADSTYTDIVFDSLVPNPGSYYIGFLMPTDPGDTVVVYSSEAGIQSSCNAWEMRATGAWYNFGASYSFLYNIDLFIFPVMTGVMGLQPLQADNHLEIWPNPANCELHFRIENTCIESWAVADINGRIVMSDHRDSKEAVRIDISSLHPGVYTLSIKTGNSILSRRFQRVP